MNTRPGSLSAARPHCVCTVVQNVDYDGAATKLACKRAFLEDRISQLPHQKIGVAVAFCDCDLRVIQALCTVLPDDIHRDLVGPAVEPERTETDQEPGVRSLHDVRPAGARRRRTATGP